MEGQSGIFFSPESTHSVLICLCQSCTLDIAMHLPRTTFSESDFGVIRWLMNVNGIETVPSVRSIKTQVKKLHNKYGVRTLYYQGAFGNRYCVNSLKDIIAQVSMPIISENLILFQFQGNGQPTGPSTFTLLP
jgi:hypothetical protein